MISRKEFTKNAYEWGLVNERTYNALIEAGVKVEAGSLICFFNIPLKEYEAKKDLIISIDPTLEKE